MGQALYRRYRSKNLSEIIGQEHITSTLENALKKGAISHAYLLTGPRGVGKTSIARILAHQVNGLPYEGEKAHLDIIEIDAASNRRIDEIRDLRDKVHTAPASAKYKVYIIDEVHMLTREAFNALLKTLEEPPQHVIFILATTDVHKLPETIVSRTQHFTFRPISSIHAIEHLKTIASKESLDIEEEALRLIAEHGSGSFRDSIGLLEQASSQGSKITAETVRTMLGIPPKELIDQLIEALENANSKGVINSLHEMYLNGYLPEQVASQLAAAYRTKLVNNQTSSIDILSLLKELLEVPASRNPSSLLELAILSQMPRQSTGSNESTQPAENRKPQTEQKKELINNDSPKSQSMPLKKPKKTTPKEPDNKRETIEAKLPEDRTVNLQVWERSLDDLKKMHSTLYSVARMASFSANDREVTLLFTYPFHKKKLDDTKNKQIIASILTKHTGYEVIINCDLAKDKPAPGPVTEKPSQANAVEDISNIFGDAEMLES